MPPLVRLVGQHYTIHHDASLLERELAVFRSWRQRKPTNHSASRTSSAKFAPDSSTPRSNASSVM